MSLQMDPSLEAFKRVPRSSLCLFDDPTLAVLSCAQAQSEYESMPKDLRRKLVTKIREVGRCYGRQFAISLMSDMSRGREEDKARKIATVTLQTPGCEDIQQKGFTGDHGLSIIDYSPYGVIASIVPITNPTATVINHCISMLAGGNGIVFQPHPRAIRCTCDAIALIHNALVKEGAPSNLIVGLTMPTKHTVGILMEHRLISAIIVTGGRPVVERAMRSGKKAFCAGPGNPPVVVDETADLIQAAYSIFAGASFDNNMSCTAEKSIFVVGQEAYTELILTFKKMGVYILTEAEVEKCLPIMFVNLPLPGENDALLVTENVGLDAKTLLAQAGIHVPLNCRLAIAPVKPDHPMVWTEQMMPIIPICLMPNWDSAVKAAAKAENGRLHSAAVYTKRMERVGEFGRRLPVCNLVVNGCISCGVGQDGEGYTSFGIAGLTGEGFTRPSTFVRERRLTCPEILNHT